MKAVQPHRSYPLVMGDYTSAQDMRAWMDTITDEVNGRFVVVDEWTIREIGDFANAGAVISGDEIHIPDGIALSIKGDLDLKGFRLVMDGDASIKGTNPETASIYSSLSSGAMIYSESILNVRDITLNTDSGAYSVEVNGTGNPNAVIDWFAVNFRTGKAAKLTSLNNANCILIGVLFPENGFEFYGTFGTVSFSETILQVSGSGKTGLKFDSGVTITRRIRLNFCAFVANSSAVGIDVPVAITIPDDTYILFFCNFSGSGTYTSGIVYSSLKSRWYQNRGIKNTSRFGQYYVENNATATTVALANTYYKLAGTTTALADNSGFSHSNNRLTCTSVVTKFYVVTYSVTFTAGAADVIAFKIYKNGSEVLGSKSKATANPAGRAENISGFAIVELALNDYIEIWTANQTLAVNIVGVDYTLLAAEQP